MSTVYRAFDETLERWVAIKLHAPRDLGGPRPARALPPRGRAVASSRTTRTSSRVIDAGEDDGHPYIVFEYVEGENLKERIRARRAACPSPRPWPTRSRSGRALERAHASKLVHRDVKPQNVLIDSEGRAKVTDFGIARSLEAEGLTATGRVLGTTDYVAPEQALGEETDRAVRPLLARHLPLRDAHRRRAVQGGEPGGRRHEAREGPAAGHTHAAAGGLGRARVGRRARVREGDRQPLRHRGRDGPRARAVAR